MEIFLLYSALTVFAGYYFYLLGYNRAHKDWLEILRADPTSTAGQLLEIAENFERRN